jgi:putative secretion ATPase (PEP-CTERM system associated)
MYSDYYKLSGKPFQLSPNPRFFFGSRGHQKAMAYLQYGLHQGEGFIVVTGDIGTGKTTLIGYLLGQLDSSKYVAAKLVTTQLEADDTLRMVATAFGVDARGADKATLLRNFERFALESQNRGQRILVVVDEVQNLPLKSLEELRMLSNFQVNDVAAVQFCLLGQPQFRSTLASDDLVQLRQRVVVAYHLGPLSADETRAYIEHRLQLVGWRSDPALTDGAYRRIHHFAAGVPRQINVLCDRLFLYGMLEELHQLDDTVVENVAGEMSSEGMRTGLDAGQTHALASKEAPRVLDNAEAAEIEKRLSSIEKQVKVHDRTIKRAIELAASYLNGALIPEGTNPQREAVPPREAQR